MKSRNQKNNVINLDYNGAINKTLHVILQDLFAKSFNDFKNKL